MAGKKRKVDIKSKQTVFKGRYKIDEIVFDSDRVSGKGRITDARRELFERGDSAAGLIHDVDRDVIVLTEQFRIATYEKGPGYLLETMAGSVEEGEKPEDCLRREMMEEVGYKAGKLTFVAAAYASPGASTERIFLYYAPVRTSDLVDPDASGVAAEKEDVGRVEFMREEFLKRLDKGGFEDGKVVTLGFWLKAQPNQGKPAKTARAKAKAKRR
jgi:nudix-type nucleoside diphosphatase (YffH/AdpP family)